MSKTRIKAEKVKVPYTKNEGNREVEIGTNYACVWNERRRRNKADFPSILSAQGDDDTNQIAQQLVCSVRRVR